MQWCTGQRTELRNRLPPKSPDTVRQINPLREIPYAARERIDYHSINTLSQSSSSNGPYLLYSVFSISIQLSSISSSMLSTFFIVLMYCSALMSLLSVFRYHFVCRTLLSASSLLSFHVVFSVKHCLN